VTSTHRPLAALVGASFFIATAACGTPQVVGDEACERYEIDMAWFASCIDGKVVRPAPDARDIPIAAGDQSHYAVFFAPDLDDRLTFLLAGIMPGIDGAPGLWVRRDYKRGCGSEP